MCTVYCVLCTVYCVLCTVYCVLCTVYCVLCTVYCAEIDQKRELVHFGKLTPPLDGRIPEMQMPMFKSATNDETWKKNQKKIRPFFLHPFGKFGRSDLIFRICPANLPGLGLYRVPGARFKFYFIFSKDFIRGKYFFSKDFS